MEKKKKKSGQRARQEDRNMGHEENSHGSCVYPSFNFILPQRNALIVSPCLYTHQRTAKVVSLSFDIM